MVRLVVEADGGSRGNPGPAGYGALVRDADTGTVLVERAAAIGRATNNVAEYRGLIAGLSAVHELGLDLTSVEVRMDSKLVIEQMAGRWQVKHPSIRPLARQAADLLSRLPAVTLVWVPRERNRAADRLANEAMDDAKAGRDWVPRDPEPPAGDAAPCGSPPNRLSGWMAAPAPPTTTLLLRHGETVFSAQRRFSGLGETPLSERGRAQAAAAAARLAGGGLDAVVSSPLRRARETAAAVAGVLDLPVEVDEDLRETDFGEWEGATFAEVQARWPAELAAWLADPVVPPPGGESVAATGERVGRALQRLLARYGVTGTPAGEGDGEEAAAGRRVLVVSHVTPIKTLLRLALAAPPVAMYRIHLDLACLSEIDWYADGPAVVRSLNDTAHLA